MGFGTLVTFVLIFVFLFQLFNSAHSGIIFISFILLFAVLLGIDEALILIENCLEGLLILTNNIYFVTFVLSLTFWICFSLKQILIFIGLLNLLSVGISGGVLIYVNSSFVRRILPFKDFFSSSFWFFLGHIGQLLGKL